MAHTSLLVGWASLPALVYLLTTFVAASTSLPLAWRAARVGTGLALLVAWLLALHWVLDRLGAPVSVPGLAPGDGVSMVLLPLVTTLGALIVGFSRRYLAGEPGQRRYLRALLLTLAAVSVVVSTTHLWLMAAAWTATGLGLHVLLTFYADRPAAQLAARKKFVASRVADIAMLAALALFALDLEAPTLAALHARLAGAEALPWTLHLAAALLVAAAALRTAQVPAHGWLLQVMEAPTPVSALLHAGVVNLGGVVLVRYSELVSAVPVAQVLLVVGGVLTAAVAGLVALTRVSIKLRLAWSTCAQMGFMLLECGLGLYALALLHLVAHSLYKAHAFLTAGEALQRTQSALLAPSELAPGVGAQLAGALAGLMLVGAVALGWHLALPGIAIEPLALLIGGLALGPLWWGAARWSTLLMNGVLLANLYVGLHAGAFALWQGHLAAGPLQWALAAFTAALLVSVQALQALLIAKPRGALARRLFPAFYAGWHLDEHFTRMTLRLWPLAPAARA
ncbi:MAG: NADH-quinone oxidoreductase subunit L [Gammaproteobacteria bacterium]|nr:NADH-quinone oxidoreductase subunit L [Gammaproteobacteria bacterium]